MHWEHLVRFQSLLVPCSRALDFAPLKFPVSRGIARIAADNQTSLAKELLPLPMWWHFGYIPVLNRTYH